MSRYSDYASSGTSVDVPVRWLVESISEPKETAANRKATCCSHVHSRRTYANVHRTQSMNNCKYNLHVHGQMSFCTFAISKSSVFHDTAAYLERLMLQECAAVV